MTAQLARLAQRIFDELEKVNLAIQRAQRGWNDFQDSGNDLFLDSVALSLQSAYNGIEVILGLIARDVDRHQPKGDRWHQTLLEQMTDAIEGTRPAVISAESYQALNEFRGFRHVARHLYAFELDSERIAQMMELLEPTFTPICEELKAFAHFLLARISG